MSTFQLFIVCVTVLAIVAVIAGRRRETAPASAFRGLEVGERVGVHFADGQSIEGLVIGVADHLILGDVRFHTPGVGQTNMKGLCRVPLRGVVMVQELEGTTPRIEPSRPIRTPVGA